MDQDTDLAGPASEPTPLSELFKSPLSERSAGQPSETTTAETGEAPRAERARDEAGKFAPKAPEQAAPPAVPNAEQGQMAALKAEREKRQGLERRLQEMEARLAAPPQQQAPAQPVAPQQPPAGFWDDPEKALLTTREQLQQDFERRLQERDLALSERFVKASNPDYDEATTALHEYMEGAKATRDPVRLMEVNNIALAIRNSADPAATALQIGRQAKALKDANGDPEAMFNARVEAEVAKRLAPTSTPDPVSPAPRLPTSLASARAAQSRSEPVASGPTPLSQLLGRTRR